VKALLAAIATLSILPISKAFSERDLSASLLYFPLVGLLIGAFLMAATHLLRPIFPPLVLSALLLFISVLLTGGLHLDGLADLCDGLGAGATPKRILSVMKDSHIGAFGVIALMLVLLLKFSLFHALIEKGQPKTFLLMGLLSRWAMVLAAFIGEYPRAAGTGQPFIGKISLKRCLVASGTTVIFSWAILQSFGLLAMLLVALSVIAFVRTLKSKIGGLTGDALGALNEKVEVLVLLFLVLIFP